MASKNDDLLATFKIPTSALAINDIYADVRPLGIIIVTVKDSLNILCFGQMLKPRKVRKIKHLRSRWQFSATAL